MELNIQIQGNKIFAPLKNQWVSKTQEELLKQEFVARLVNFYGYNLNQLGQDLEIKNKVRVDIAIWKNEKDKKDNKIPSIIIAIECKAEHVSIKQEDIFLSYKIANSVNANFFIATNLKETKVYHIQTEAVSRNFEKLRDIPHATKIQNEKSIINFIQETKAFTRDEFSKLLSKCHNIIRNNDKLSPEAAFDEISKILFMKIMYERKSKEEIIFSLDKFKVLEKEYEERTRPTLKSANPNFDFNYIQFLFEETKRNYATDEIFESNDSVRIRQNSFEQIVKELESFNLSDTSDDVKGIAFEEFLGKTFRGELGQFFTPRTIVDFMVEVLDPQEGEIICDPCCGSGGFLIKTFEFIRDKIETDIQSNKEKIKKLFLSRNQKNLSDKKKLELPNTLDDLYNQLGTELDLGNEQSRLRALSYDCIFGTDANPRMARTAKMNMIMHGDGHGGVHHHDGLLNINGVFDGRFDVIITNPPFGARVEKSLKVTGLDIPTQEKIEIYKKRYPDYEEKVIAPLKAWVEKDNGLNKPKGTSILELFEVGRMSGLTEVLFLERCINLLKPGGRMGIVLPEGVLNNSALQKIREFIESKAKIINITSIPQDVFIASGATVKPSLLFLKKFTAEEEDQYKKLLDSINIDLEAHSKIEIEKLKKQYDEKIKNKKTAKNQQLISDLKKEYDTSVKQINHQVEDDRKKLIREKFDYSISVVEVEKAGISSTGAPCENELETVAVEFKKFASENQVWEIYNPKAIYSLSENNKIARTWKTNNHQTESKLL